MAQVVDEMMSVLRDEGPGICCKMFINGIADNKIRVLLAVARESAQQHQHQAEEGEEAQHGQSAPA